MFCCYCVVHMIVRKHMDGRMASAERNARDTAAFGFSPLSTDSGHMPQMPSVERDTPDRPHY